jgi:DNA-binding response OmpR family regulator
MKTLMLIPEEIRKHYQHLIPKIGFVDEAYDEDDALSILSMNGEYNYDVFINVTEGHNTFPEQIRQRRIHVPIVVLTPLHTSEMVIDQLRQGADQVIFMPEDERVVCAYIDAVVRRSQVISGTVVEWGPLTIDLHKKCLLINGKDVRFTPTQYRIFEVLARAQGRTMRYEALYDAVYGETEKNCGNYKLLNVHICKLNQRAQSWGGLQEKAIATTWGIGMRLNPDILEGERSLPCAS